MRADATAASRHKATLLLAFFAFIFESVKAREQKEGLVMPDVHTN